MKKTFKVVMLPTEEAINDYSLVLLPNNKLQIMSPSDMIDYLDSQSNATKRQELYIISDDDKEGDWYIDNRVIDTPIVSNTPMHKDKIFACKKIVATTDVKITSDYSTSGTTFVASIPESFIQAYIKAYNEGKPITEVDLEREQLQQMDAEAKYFTQLKLRPNNTVIIHQSKMYSKEEVEKLCEKAFRAGREAQSNLNANKCPSVWIEDNL